MKSLPNLLIVDDNPEQLLYLVIILKKLNANLIKAESALEALEKTKGLELALAIIDVRMPEINGYELALKMNEERFGEKVPIIFLTASHINEIQVFQGYSSGAVDYIFKPVSNHILLCKVKVFLDLFSQKQTILQNGIELRNSAEELMITNSALKVSEEKYRTMLNASPDGISITNLKGIITDISAIGLELFGIENSEELIGKHFLRFVPPEEKLTIRGVIEKTMNEGIAQNIEIKIRKKNQTLFLSEVSSTLIQTPDGIPFSFMITIRDISQRKKLEKMQIHADRMASLGEMASGIAHEINQPLNTISMVMDNILYEAAKDENVPKDYLKKKSDKIFENITRIKNIIDHVRTFSRSHDDYILTGFDINSSIHNAITMISEQFKHLGINMNLQLGENLPSIIGNTYKFEQVILNLFSNAKDALLEKKSKEAAVYNMSIRIRSYLENQCVIVEMTDNGAGISEEDIDHIMLPFYTTKDAGKGTGLGLSISYQIIKEMNGTIELSSNVLIGTTFKLILVIEKVISH
jgi:PAS domain S-box-containing protein